MEKIEPFPSFFVFRTPFRLSFFIPRLVGEYLPHSLSNRAHDRMYPEHQRVAPLTNWKNACHWTELTWFLGPTNPCSTAVHMEPFPTSVFKVLIWIFATTTKICTRVGSTPPYGQSFLTNPTSSYSSQHSYFTEKAGDKFNAWAPSIFRANSFGRWVVTHSLADFDFHDHRPAVWMNQHLLWGLMSVD